MRRFEYTDARSNKFWEIRRRGARFMVRYGRMGSDGGHTEKRFDTVAEAEKAVARLIRQKRAKGYVEVPVDPTEASRLHAGCAPPNPVLEAAVIDEAPAALEVFGDWLTRHGDVRGELIALEAMGTPAARARIEALEEAHMHIWLGDGWALRDTATATEIELEHGFARSACIAQFLDEQPTMAEQTLALLDSPAARLLGTLILGPGGQHGEVRYDRTLERLHTIEPLPNLRRLHIGDFDYPFHSELSWVDAGDLTVLADVFPGLRDLHVTAGMMTCARFGSALRRLCLETGGLSAGVVGAISAAELPELTELEVWFGCEDYGAATAPEELDGLLAAVGVPKLKVLRFKNAEAAPDLLARLVDSPLLARIETLDLSMGVLTDETAAPLITHAGRFSHLKTLLLDENYLTGDFFVRLGGRSADARGQRQQSEHGLYTSVGE